MEEKPKILLVDDEVRILRSLGLLLRMQYQVFATSDGNEALDILAREHIHVLISDQRMPIMTGTELLSRARKVSPKTVRILLTGYADAAAVEDSVNEAEIFRYINKPWGPTELRDTIGEAMVVALKDNPAAVSASPATATGLAAAAAAPLPQVDDTRPLTCLVLDQDATTYNIVCELLEPEHQVILGRSVTDALRIAANERVAILVTELSLGDQDLSSMLNALKKSHPELLTIILSRFRDTPRLIEMVNAGQIYRYIGKPLNKNALATSLVSSLERYLGKPLSGAASKQQLAASIAAN